jgi:hypothetical protein
MRLVLTRYVDFKIFIFVFEIRGQKHKTWRFLLISGLSEMLEDSCSLDG